MQYLNTTTTPTQLLQLAIQTTTGTGTGTAVDGFPGAARFMGWVSIGCWVVVYSPQLYLCYLEQSGEGLSLLFLAIWLAGDVTNLLGAIWQGLLPTMIILAVYYTLCDSILILQVFYYRRKHALHSHRRTHPTSLAPQPERQSESTPLLPASSEPSSLPEPQSRLVPSLILLFGVVSISGILVYNYFTNPSPYFFPSFRASRLSHDGAEKWDNNAQILGWTSAVLCLASRVPQLIKNTETKCHGLSLLMFAFTIAGNSTYVASILLQSLTPQHLWINLSWLVAAGGPILLDFVVLGQFWYFADARRVIDESAKLALELESESETGGVN